MISATKPTMYNFNEFLLEDTFYEDIF